MTHRFNLRTFCIPATVVLMILVLASMCCASRIVDGDPNTIGAVLSQRDGTTVTLTGEQIIWCGKSGKSFAIKETFDKQPPLDNPRLVVVSTRSLPVENSWTVDVTGVLSTMPSTSKDGGAITQRVLIVSPENVTVYCDSTGKAIFCPPVKALRMDWPTKRSLAQLSGTNTIQSASISAMDVGGLPVMDDSPDSESITPAEGSRDGLKWLPDGAKVHLKNRPVLQSNYLIFSIEEPDRTNSIRVCPTYGYSPSTGDLVEIYGTMATVDGERVVKLDTNETDYVDLLTVQDTGCTMPFPVGLPNKAAGGGALGSFTPAIGSSTGLNNTGMLATVWGKVTASSIVNPAGYWYCYIDDGSGLTCADSTTGASQTGIRVYANSNPTVGSYQSITGVISSELLADGTTSIPILRNISYTLPTYTSGSGTISGTITADANAAGRIARIHGTCGSTTCTLDSSGVGAYSLSAKPGSHTVSVDVAGYAHAAAKATVTANQATDTDFTLTSIGKNIYAHSNSSRILPDGTSTTTVNAIVFDEEGRRLSGQSVTWTIDLGTIVSSDSVTNAVGEATATVRSATTADTATISISCGGVTGHSYVEYASPTAPVVRILTPTQNESLSGEVTVKVSAEDAKDTEIGIVQIGVSLDGEPLMPLSVGRTEAPWATYRIPNGVHQIKAAASNYNLEIGYSQAVTVNVSNTAYSVSETSAIINTSNPSTTISATLSSSMDWTVDIIDTSEATTVKSFIGSGTSVSATWDGTASDGTDAVAGTYTYSVTSSGTSIAKGTVAVWRTTGAATALIVEGATFSTNAAIMDEAAKQFKKRNFDVITIPNKSATWENFVSAFNTYPVQALFVTSHGEYEIRNDGDCNPSDIPQITGFFLKDAKVYSYRPEDSNGNYFAQYPIPGAYAYANLTQQYGNFYTHYVSEIPSERRDDMKFVWMDACFCGRIGSGAGDTSSSTNPYNVTGVNDMASMFYIYDNAYTIGACYAGYYEQSAVDDHYKLLVGCIFGSLGWGYTMQQAVSRDAYSYSSGYLRRKYTSYTELDGPCKLWRWVMPPYHNLRIHGNPSAFRLTPH